MREEDKVRSKTLVVLGISVVVLALLGVGSTLLAEPPRPGAADEVSTQREADVAETVGSGFTYQGYLTDGGSPANGTYDFEFRLYDDPDTGTQVGSTVTVDDKTVTDGLFMVELDFGSGAFNGEARYLEIGVRPGGSTGAYTTLSPRQPLTATPFALSLPGLYTQPDAGIPNVIGGWVHNLVWDEVMGATISGGGGPDEIENVVTDRFGTIGGGANNLAGDESGDTTDAWFATVGGGWLNRATSYNATVAGGAENTASGGSSFVGGGWLNAASGELATVGGGRNNTASGAYHATVGGGDNNIASGEWNATVAGGAQNVASESEATVGGGAENTASGVATTVSGGIGNTASGEYNSTVGGGYGNTANASDSTVGGGNSNTAAGWAATISGGYTNTVTAGAATIGGGKANTISGDVATISGGDSNVADGLWAVIGGGQGNTASGNATTIGGGGSNEASNHYATVGGGGSNAASGNSATIGGGQHNATNGDYATVGGGASNAAEAIYAAIGGGGQNAARGQASTIAGGEDNEAEASYATVCGGWGNRVSAAFGVIAGGGRSNPDDPDSGNRVTDQHCAIGGGGSNLAGSDNGDATDARYATVGGGWKNSASAEDATVGGGSQNRATGDASTISGGRNNQVEDQYATIGGGNGNIALDVATTVAGGSSNKATHNLATVGGGQMNVASGSFATVAGGAGNKASHTGATVSGGSGNEAGGLYAAVPGGQGNKASGMYSFAAGYNANAAHAGAFVWADSQASLFSSTAEDQFLIQASGGVGIGTKEPMATLHIQDEEPKLILAKADGRQWNMEIGPFGQGDEELLSIGTRVVGEYQPFFDSIMTLATNGMVSVETLRIANGLDLAEPFSVAGLETTQPGMALSIDPDHPGRLRISDRAYDRLVAGCISGANGINPGLIMAQEDVIGEDAVPVALTGRVYCYADASYGPIQPGDLLTTSDTPGHVMAVGDYQQAQGAIIGKAMSALEKGRGFVLVLVSLQ